VFLNTSRKFLTHVTHITSLHAHYIKVPTHNLSHLVGVNSQLIVFIATGGSVDIATANLFRGVVS